MATSALPSTTVGRNPHPHPADRGAAVVEFALVVGLLMLIIGGIVTYGLLLSYRQVLTQGATDGVRAASLTADDPLTLADERLEAARTAVDASLDAVDRTCQTVGHSDGLTCQLSIVTCPNDATETCARVTLTHDNLNHPIVPPILLAGLTPDTVSVSTVSIVNG